jgi:hypothetical protein
MTFQSFYRKPMGARGVGDGISINKTQITLGKHKPPFEYAQIEYDTEANALRLSAGTEDTGFRVRLHKSSYFINAYRFVRVGLLPLGRYSRGETKETQWTFRKLQPPQPKSREKME